MIERLMSSFSSSRAAAAPAYAAMVAEGDQAIDARRQKLAEDLATAIATADKDGEAAARALASAQATEAKAAAVHDQARQARLAAEATASSVSTRRQRLLEDARRALAVIEPPELVQFREDLELQIEALRHGRDDGPLHLAARPGIYRNGTSENPVLAALFEARRTADELILRGNVARVRAGIELLRKQIALADQEHAAALQAVAEQRRKDDLGGRRGPGNAMESAIFRAAQA